MREEVALLREQLGMPSSDISSEIDDSNKCSPTNNKKSYRKQEVSYISDRVYSEEDSWTAHYAMLSHQSKRSRSQSVFSIPSELGSSATDGRGLSTISDHLALHSPTSVSHEATIRDVIPQTSEDSEDDTESVEVGSTAYESDFNNGQT